MFDQFVNDGVDSSVAVSRAISEHFGISIDAANAFVSEAGISANQWADIFSDASGLAIESMQFFGEQGEQVLAEISGNAEASALATAGAFRNQLTGTLSTINLGQFNIPSASFNVTASGVTNSQTIPNLGNFNTGGSFTVPDTGRGGGDQPFIIGLARSERVTVEPVSNSSRQNSNGEVSELYNKVDSLTAQVSNLVGELARGNNKANAFQS